MDVYHKKVDSILGRIGKNEYSWFLERVLK